MSQKKRAKYGPQSTPYIPPVTGLGQAIAALNRRKRKL